MKQLFPKEIVENTVEAHYFEHRNRSKIIYGILLSAAIAAFITLPFITIPIYITARGILKPNKERVSLASYQSGTVTQISLVDNQLVKAGDTLLVLRMEALESQRELVQKQIEERNINNRDLSMLIAQQRINRSNLQSAQYQKVYGAYQNKVQELQTRAQQTQKTLRRNWQLFTKGVIAKVEYETSMYEHQLATNALAQFKKQQRISWQSESTNYHQELLELQNKAANLQKDRDKLVLLAPINGVLKNVKGIVNGSFVTGGNPIAEISPNTKLIAECYLSPVDIGWIERTKSVMLQVDAFNYNQWGLASGKIEAISKDIDLVNEQPVFKVRCTVDRPYLSLDNNFKGYLKRGMTFNARFQLTERTLFQLLYDKVDDWLNPNNNAVTTL